MAREYSCPVCKNAVDSAATICSNPVCRVELAFCSHCRDVATYSLSQPRTGRLDRDKYKCGRCERIGVKCLTWLAGGYCNGLATTGEKGFGQPFCAHCNTRAGEVGRSVVGWSLIGALGGLLKPRK